MARFKTQKTANRASHATLSAELTLECTDCDQCYRRHASGRLHAFARSEGVGGRALDARALLKKRAAGPGRKRKLWTPAPSALLRVIVGVFGEEHLAVSQVVFDFGQDFLRKKAAELLAPPASPLNTRAKTPLMRDELKDTPNFSTADKPNGFALQLTPGLCMQGGLRFTPRLGMQEALRFTPRLGVQEGLRFTPQSCYYPQARAAAPNPFGVCKFPEIELDHEWEPSPGLAAVENPWPSYNLSGISPLLSSAATPVAALNRHARPFIERL